MPIPFLVQLLIGVALNIIAYMLMPQPKVAQPPETKEPESPTAEAGIPIRLLSGSKTIKSLNILATMNKQTVRRKVSGSSKK